MDTGKISTNAGRGTAWGIMLCLLLPHAAPVFGGERSSFSGRLTARGVQKLETDSIRRDPGLEGRLRLDAGNELWRFHSWLEGGWDGTVKRPARDSSLFKSYDEVYQSNTPFLEFKELFTRYSSGSLDISAGIQRFSWGRLDEYPPNDLLNPWDYTRFLRKPLEDRKIGVPSLSASVALGESILKSVWVPVFVPYRLPMLDERWSGSTLAATIAQAVPNAEIAPQEPDLPDRTIENGNVGIRLEHFSDIEWAVSLFHGYDPRPVFRTTALAILPGSNTVFIDPGYVPDFHRITAVGMDGAAVPGDEVSLRVEIVYTFNRYLNIRRELWGYPPVLSPGLHPLNPAIQEKHDTLDYGIGADYRLFEDGLLTVQAQQTFILGNTDHLYERQRETILWANLKAGFLNQKVETNFNTAYNPEHGDRMVKINVWYVFSDAWKAGATYVAFAGPPESIFGRYFRNDQVEAELVYAW